MVFTNNPIVTMLLHMPIMSNKTEQRSPIICFYSSTSLSPLVTSLCLPSVATAVVSIPSIPAPVAVKGDWGRGAVCQPIVTGGEIAGIVFPIAMACVDRHHNIPLHAQLSIQFHNEK
jgi:hypothetical protein